jgi:hypothetical protein
MAEQVVPLDMNDVDHAIKELFDNMIVNNNVAAAQPAEMPAVAGMSVSTQKKVLLSTYGKKKITKWTKQEAMQFRLANPALADGVVAIRKKAAQRKRAARKNITVTTSIHFE